MEERRLPTTEDVVKKIKDDGDFDALRLKIIRVVKENEELRKNIIDQVKQSNILNQDGSEDMKPRQLSDAIYQELGRKITGQISDEIWKTIRINESMKSEIKGTVESVLDKMVSSTEPQTSEGSIPSLAGENQIVGREADGIIETPIATPAATQSNILNSNEANVNNSDIQEKEQGLASIQNLHGLLNQTKAKDLLPGLGSSRGGGGGGGGGGEADDDSDLPPGFS